MKICFWHDIFWWSYRFFSFQRSVNYSVLQYSDVLRISYILFKKKKHVKDDIFEFEPSWYSESYFSAIGWRFLKANTLCRNKFPFWKQRNNSLSYPLLWRRIFRCRKVGRKCFVEYRSMNWGKHILWIEGKLFPLSVLWFSFQDSCPIYHSLLHWYNIGWVLKQVKFYIHPWPYTFCGSIIAGK